MGCCAWREQTPVISVEFVEQRVPAVAAKGTSACVLWDFFNFNDRWHVGSVSVREGRVPAQIGVRVVVVMLDLRSVAGGHRLSADSFALYVHSRLPRLLRGIRLRQEENGEDNAGHSDAG